MKVRSPEPTLKSQPVARKAEPAPAARAAPPPPAPRADWSAKPSSGAPPPSTASVPLPAASRSLAAADVGTLNRALHAGLTGLGTDERAIFSTLAARSPAHLTEVKRLYQEHFGLSLEADLGKDLGAHDLARAKALLSGDPTQGTVEALRSAISGREPEALIDTLEALAPAELGAVAQRFAAGGTSLEAAITNGVLGPTRDVALALVRGQRPQAEATRLDSALNLMGNTAAALEVLSASAPGERAAIAQAYQQRTGRPLEADVGRRMKGTEKDQALGLLSGDAGAVKVARLRHAVEGRVMGLGKDATAALAVIEGTPAGERAALDARYQQKYGISLGADVEARFGGRDKERLTQALGGKLDDVERIQIALKGYGADKTAVQAVLGGRSVAEMKSLKQDFAARTGGSLDGALKAELSGRALFDATVALEGAPETPEAAVALAARRRDFERGGSANAASRMVMDLVSSDGTRMDKAVRDAQAALASNSGDKAGRIAELTGLAKGDVSAYRASKESVGDAVATAAALGVTVATGGLGAPLAVGVLAGAGVSVAANAAIAGRGYSSEDATRDAVKGSLGALSGGAGAKTAQSLLGRAAQSAARAGVNGFVSTASDTALRNETWNSGATDGLYKAGVAGAKAGAMSAAMAAAQAVGTEALRPTQSNVVATKLPSGEVDLSTYKADKAARDAMKKGMDPHTYKSEESMAKFFKENHPELKTIHTQDLMALRGYTGKDYTLMNQALRGKAPTDLVKLDPKIRVAASALAKMPAFDGTVYRKTNLTPENFARYQVGKTISEKAFMSTSTEKAATAASTAFAGNTDFVIKSKGGGRMVQLISDFPAEKEVLFPPGTEFKVLKRTSSAGRNVVFLQEVQ